jgi:hypothetical protein
MKELVLLFLILPLPGFAAQPGAAFHSCVAQNADSAGAHSGRCYHILY